MIFSSWKQFLFLKAFYRHVFFLTLVFLFTEKATPITVMI